MMNDITNALFSASRKGNVPVLKEIFDIIKDVNVTDDKGYTPLIIAAYNNQPEAVTALLSAGAFIDATDGSGNTALMGACFKGYAEVAQLLLDSGANVNAVHGNGGTALMFAVMFGRNDMIDLLLDNGADVTIKDKRGLTVLEIAHQQRNTFAAEKLEKTDTAM